MNKYLKIILAVAAFTILIGGSYILYDQLLPQYVDDELETVSVDETMEEAPTMESFTVTDIDGNEVELSSFIGKPIIVNFWASWCPPCKLEMPDLQEAYNEYGDEIQFLMVNVTLGSRESIETATSYIESENYTFPVYFDVEGDATNKYSVNSIPATYFFDKNGNIIASKKGMITADQLQSGIDSILE